MFFLPHAPHSPRTKYRSLGRCFDSPLARTTQPYCSCSREETPGVKYQPLWSAHHFLSLPRERALTLEIPISGASEKHYTIAFLESSGKPTYAGNRVRVCCLLLLWNCLFFIRRSSQVCPVSFAALLDYCSNVSWPLPTSLQCTRVPVVVGSSHLDRTSLPRK